jgi:fructose-1-phosphate kinase PfkB-like protein
VMVTQGPAPAYLLTRDGKRWRLYPPRLEHAANPIGSGDCATAGIVCKLMKRRPLQDALAFGLACGTANATTWTPADFDPRLAVKLCKLVRIERIASPCPNLSRDRKTCPSV